jgi:ubiquinone/menaquinone biosynthesis C-methylase UbiE
MDHTDHVNLLRAGVGAPGGVWADFGAGSGAFTLALADLLGPTGEIIAIDRDAGRLRINERAMRERFPQTSVRYVVGDFGEPLELPALNGIVIANALHFATDQSHVVALLHRCLSPGAPILIVEYNIERGNSAVPYPVPFSRWQALAGEAGLGETKLLATRPSRFLREIYSAASW